MELINVFPMQTLGIFDYAALVPLFLLSFGALFSLILGTQKEHGHKYAFTMSVSVLAIAVIYGGLNVFSAEEVVLGKSLVFNSFTKSLGLMAMFFALIAVVLTYGQDKKEGLLSEIYGLILFATAGMVLMVSSNHLLFMFIALEIMSLAIYVLVAMRRSSRFSAEAGLKYFILGGLASALFLYGSSLVFGSSGSFELAAIKDYLTANPSPSFIYYMGLGLIVTALLFKVGAFPFHGWVPDVYQGAATNVTGFMGAAVKFTAFMAFANIARHMVYVPNVANLVWFENFIWLASAASMIYGNFVAISQTEIKRMLSFSTIAHTGYLLMGLHSMRTGAASESLILYLFFYALSNLGAFAVISMFESKNQKDLTLEQLTGMGLKHPLMGAFLTLFLLSMAGIPLTSGFIGKYGLFNSVVISGDIPLVVIAVLTSVVSVYYYLRVIVYMFMKESVNGPAVYNRMSGASLVALLSAVATLQFGLFPKVIIQLVRIFSK